MKLYISKIFMVICLLFSTYYYTQYKVKGNCEMCKTRIENTAKNAGASSPSYSIENNLLTLKEKEPSKIDGILKAVADAGHDNEKYTAEDKIYQSLPPCCLYERTEKSEKDEKKLDKNQFLVKGNCVSCKARIEKAAKSLGDASANWDIASQILTLSQDLNEEKIDAILKEIANVGHDNIRYKSDVQTYDNLPPCCLYDRDSPLGENSKIHFTEEEKVSNIKEVKVSVAKASTALQKKEAGLVFNINKTELLKAACCNLSESFETNATVDVSFSNAVTGTKQLKMLGLDQKYTSLTKELLPEIRGIASAYGLNLIPGRWIESIQLVKGGSTVTNGYESITGQINTELIKHTEEPETSINLFSDFNGRAETNITHVAKIDNHWSQTFLLHGNGTFGDTDMNNDGFLDRPKGNQINANYLLNFNDIEHTGLASHFGIGYVKDERTAGQLGYDNSLPQDKQSAYGVGIDISRFQAWNKTGYVFTGKPYQSIGWMNQVVYHQQNSFFGNRNYLGKQTTYYSNLLFESILGSTLHKYKAGASFLYDQYNEHYVDKHYNRNEVVPGAFIEYTYSGDKMTIVAGSRIDFHNLAGVQYTPRVNLKYDFTPTTVLRLSAGKGFRTANVFAENQQYFASNRTIEIKTNDGKIYGLQPEIAWNYGASLQKEFKLLGKKSSILVDAFRTDFSNQVLVDLDQSAQKLVFYNLHGRSFANSIQTQWDFSPIKNLEIRLAYKYYDVQADYHDGRREVPFMAKNRGFVNIAYATKKNNKGGYWSIDTTLNGVGKQRLPNLNTNPIAYRLPEYSDAYWLLNAQISRNFTEKIRVYFGGENLTSYAQHHAIIDYKNPFGSYFDGGMVYAPIMKANFYLGLDFSF